MTLIKRVAFKHWIKTIEKSCSQERHSSTAIIYQSDEIPFCNKMTSESTSDDLGLAKRTPEMPTVQEISESMQNFGTSDYTVFAVMLIACGFVGIYFGFVNKSSGEDEYLVGGRNMKTFPVSLSLIASFISGKTIFLHSTNFSCTCDKRSLDIKISKCIYNTHLDLDIKWENSKKIYILLA